MRLTKSEHVILDYLAAHAGETFYESQISNKTLISVGSANQTLKRLLKMNMVSLSRKGKMNFYSINLDSPLVKQFKITQTISELNGLIEKLKLFSKRIILFGSCAEGLDTQESDIDLTIVSNEEDNARRIIKKAKISREIQCLIFNPKEFLLLANKDKPLFERIKQGIVLSRQE